MEDNSKIISSIPSIVDCKRLQLTDVTKERLGPKLSKEAEDNEKDIFVYKITYKSQGHNVVGFIVEPREGKNLPCIIWNRGGSGDFGAIVYGQLFIDFPNIVPLAKRGYIVITTQYSGNGGSEGKDEFGGSELEDVLNLYEILKEYPRADSKRVGMYGMSRGTMMTYLTLAKVDWLKAAVAVCGPADNTEESIKAFRPEMIENAQKFFNYTKEEQIRRSAIFWADKFCKTTPLLIMHGTSDWRVNPLDSIRLSEKLYQNKIPFRLVMFEGADHALNEVRSERDKLTYEWFDRFVKNNESLPDLTPHGK